MMIVLAVFVLGSLCSSAVHGDLYVDPVLPYNRGELVVADRIITPSISVGAPPPMHTRVYYPDTENITDTTFGVYYFVTGFGGFAPANLYTDYFARVASHGYVVCGSWPVITGEGIAGINFTADAHLQNIDYLRNNLPIRIRNIADFDNIGLGCHSAGCGPTYEMAKREPARYKVILNLEPVSNAILQGVDFTTPSLMLGAELANMSCSVPGRDFETFYQEWKCPKVMFEVADVGHCAFLDQFYWDMCRVLRFCRVGEGNNLEEYREVVEGLSSAMLNTYIQGTEEHLQYVTDASLIPMPLLQHRSDVSC